MPDLATLCYVPLLDRLHPESFLRNIRHYRTTHPLILYSDHQRYIDQGMLKIPKPDSVKVSKNKTALQNCVFFLGLKIAKDMGVKRFIYMESDTRVGCDDWDGIAFDEVDGCTDMITAGTPAAWNPLGMPPDTADAAKNYIDRYTEASGRTVPVFHPKRNRAGRTGCIFHMGAISIMNTAAMCEFFHGFDTRPGQLACETPPFDLEIGLKMFRLFGARALDKMPFITSTYSGFLDKVLSEVQRVELLRSGKANAIHQYKGKLDLIFRPSSADAACASV